MNIKKAYRIFAVAVSLLMCVSFAACQTAAPTATTAAPTTAVAETAAPTAAPTEAPAATTAAPADTADSPLGKYDPAIEMTTVRSDLGTNYKYAEGESIDNNIWYKAYEDMLGIKLKNTWVVSGDQYAQKFGVAVASNDLPDVFDVGMNDLATLVDNGMVTDLTDVYNQYASALTKQINDGNGGIAIKTSTFDGKMMALPEQGSMADNLAMIWIRSDWLKKLNLTEPKTMADLVAVAKAFMTQDPDGNGKTDTYGFGLAKDFVTSGTASGAQDMVGLIYGFHAYPGGWIKDASGNLVFGSVQPEMKTALTNLQQWFKDGLIDQEFAIKDSTKVQEDEAAGKVGISFGMMWNSIWPLQASIDKDPNALWIPLPLVSADDKPALCLLSSPVGNWHVVNKNYKNPEALVKMVNLWCELMEGPNAQMTVYGTNPEGKEIFKMSMFRTWIPTQNMDDYLAVKAAIDNNDTSKLTGRQPTLLEQVNKFKAGDTTQYGYALVFGPGGSQAICADVYKNNSWVTNEFYGAPTPTMVDKNATLLKLQNEAFTKIIMGKVSIDEFDNFVSQWKQLGGDQITTEVNAWYASHK